MTTWAVRSGSSLVTGHRDDDACRGRRPNPVRRSAPLVMPAPHAEVLARFGHALSDPTRTRLLLALREGHGYPTELAELLGVSR